MKLKSFRIRNYKSIIDSGVCRLSNNDNILVLAGQNESGKSSLLQAIYDYERDSLREDSIRQFDKNSEAKFPIMEFTYIIEKEDNIGSEIEDEIAINEEIKEILNKRKEISINREFTSMNESKLNFETEIDEEITNAIEKWKVINKIITEKSDSGNSNNEPSDGDLDSDEEILVTSAEIAKEFFGRTPKIIFFDDFCDLLPDKILIEDLKNKNESAKGYRAVKNIEQILDTDLTELDSLPDAVSTSRENAHTKTLTANFNERWRQKIFDDNKVEISIKYNQGRSGSSSAYLNFFISTKEGEYLTLSQRSKGLIWFLSFYLQLKAESEATEELIILFDEPGLYLHAKAQADIKSVLEELANKDQIIYSTHSPYMIDSEKLYRLRLVINDKECGTLVEKITTNKIKNQKDALKPIIDAIGLEVAHSLSAMDQRNVIVEGISDYHYFISMKKILQINDRFSFLPSMGAQNVHLLMELCIGWGLDWLIILDEGREANTAYNKIKKNFFNNEENEVKKKVYRMDGIKDIEDAFTISDLRLVESTIKSTKGIENSHLIKNYGGKELFSRIFAEKVKNGEISRDKLSKTCIRNFEKIFKFINNLFKK